MGLREKISSAISSVFAPAATSTPASTTSRSSDAASAFLKGASKGASKDIIGSDKKTILGPSSSPSKVVNTHSASTGSTTVPSAFSKGLARGSSLAEQASLGSSSSLPKFGATPSITNGSSSSKINSSAGSKGKQTIERPSERLSYRAKRNGLLHGEDYDNASEDQKSYVRTYHNTLDRKEITVPYLELEQMIADSNSSEEAFDKKYKDLMDYIDSEMDAERKKNSTGSQQYQALKQVKEDVTRLGQQYAINRQYSSSSEKSAQLDESINAIFAGIMNAPDYDKSVDAGRKAVSEDAKAKKWFDEHMRYASETQRNLMYYTYRVEGMSGVKEMFNDYMGETLNYIDASNDFLDDVLNNPGKMGRFKEFVKGAGYEASIGGDYWGGVAQTFTNTKADPNDRTLVGDFSIEDSIDYSLRSGLGEIADSDEFQAIGSAGFAQMKADGVTGDWYNEAQKSATPFQRNVMGYIYAATEGNTKAVEKTWDGIKEQGDAIWAAVNGRSLPRREESMEGDMQYKYLNMSGPKMPGFLGGREGETIPAFIYRTVRTTTNQGPQAAVGYIGGAITGAVLSGGNPAATAAAAQAVGRASGGLAMSLSAYGNTYKEAVDQGYSDKQAAWYAAADAGNEFISDQLLGGIGGYAGKLTGDLGKRLTSQVSSALWRGLINTGIRGMGEGVQEYVQQVSDPLLRRWFLGEDTEFLTSENFLGEDAKDSFFQGAFSALLFSAVDQSLVQDIRSHFDYKSLGRSLKVQNSAVKAIDTILNSDIDPEAKTQKEMLEEAKQDAQMMKDGKIPTSDVNLGKAVSNFGFAGGDLSFLTNPETVTYTKDQISTEDMRAGAVSRLATLGADTSLAEDIANIAKGFANVSEEKQAEINSDPAAKQVLTELQGDLDMDQADNALTIAARETTNKGGANAKIADAVQSNNPDKVILTPSQQYLADQAVGLADSQRIGAVFDKVLSGEQVTKDEAKLIRMKSPAIQAAMLDLLGIDLHESVGVDTVMEALNEKAAEFARIKEMQAGVRQSIKSAEEVRRRNANGTAAQAGTGVPAQGSAAGQGSVDVGAGESGVSAGAGAASTGRPGGLRKENGSPQVGYNAPVWGPRSLKEFREQYKVIPEDKLSEEQRTLQRRLARNGAGSVAFIRGANSFTYYIEEDGTYLIAIRADSKAPFKMDQYADHETGHLWVKALSPEDKNAFLYLVTEAFGADFNKAFAQVKDFYIKKKLVPADVTDDVIVEELYCFARGAQDWSSLPRKKDTIIVFDFSKYHDAVMEIEKKTSLEAMALGDMSDPAVRANVENGNFNQSFYEHQGFLDEDGTVAPSTAPSAIEEKRTEAKQTLDKLAKKDNTQAKSEKTSETKKGKQKATSYNKDEATKKAFAPKTEKSEAEKLREHYEQRKAAQVRKFEQGKLAITTREQLQKRLDKLDAELQQKLAEIGETEASSGKNPEPVAVTPEAAVQTEREAVTSEFRDLMDQAKADPSLMTDEAFLKKAQDLEARINDLDNRLAEAEKETEKKTTEKKAKSQKSEQKKAEPQATEKKPFDYDAELKKLTDARNRQRASQYKKKAENPDKSDDSLNAQLKRIEDKYTIAVSKLKAMARKNGDIRFSADPDIEEENNEQRDRLGDSGLRGRGLGASDIRAGSGKDAVRNRAGQKNGRGKLDANALRSPGLSSNARGQRVGEQPAAEAGARRDVLPRVSRRTPEQLERNAKLHDKKRRDYERNGIMLLDKAEVKPEVREAGELIEKYLPDCNVSYVFNPRSSAAAMFCDRTAKNGKLYDAGIFINAAAFEAPDLIKVMQRFGITPRGAVSHEMAHYYLYYSSVDAKGKQGPNKSLAAFDYLLNNLTEDDASDIRDALLKTKQEYINKLGPSLHNQEDEIVEELIADLFGNTPRFFEIKGDAFYETRDLAKQYFGIETEFGDNTEEDRMAFSGDTDDDFDAEELMDRSDEMRSSMSDAQVWQDASLNELSSDSYSTNADAILAEIEANPERSEELWAKYMALQGDSFNDTDTLFDERPKKTKPKAKKEAAPAKKPAAQPSAKDAWTKTTEAAIEEMMELGGIDRAEALASLIADAEEELSVEDDNKRRSEIRNEIKLLKDLQAKTTKPSPKNEAPAPEPVKEQPETKPTTTEVEPAKAAAFDVPLSDVAGPINVAGLTLGAAKDRVYQARQKLLKQPSPDAARVQALTAQYESIQAQIKERGEKLSDPKARFGLVIEGKKEEPPVAKAFKRKAEQAKAALVTEEPVELKKPKMASTENPVNVKGLGKKKAIDKVTQGKAEYEAWYNQEKGKLDKQLDDKTISEAQYAKQWKAMVLQRNKALGRYNDQLKRLEAMEETVKEKATVVKDDSVTYTPKAGEWWNRIKNADSIQIRRLRSDRNTYDVRFTDSKGNEVIYDEVSPSRLETALGEKQNAKAEAKERLAPAYEAAASKLGEWQTVANEEPAERTYEKKVKPDRNLDNYGRKIPAKLSKYMDGSTVRDSDGKLLSVYRLGPANGVRNANPNARFTVWSEKPATMNVLRGLNGAAAYDQGGKRIGADIENWLQELADHPGMSEGNKNVIRGKIAAAERKMREYTTHVTRLDPWRPGYTNPKREDVIGNHTLLEGYVNIKNPLEINAKGKDMAWVNDVARKFVSDPANLAGELDVDGNALGDHDGLKIINVTVTPGDKTLGGGSLDRDTVYVTFHHNQGKSTYNTDPTDSDLMQYSADPDTDTGYAEGTIEDTVLKIMRDKDEAHALEYLATVMSQYFQTGVLPKIEDERTRNIFQPQVTPAQQKYLEDKAAELIAKYGRLEPGEKPARDVAFPKKTDDGNIRRVFRTAAEAKQTPDRVVPAILREALTNENAVYETITDKSAIAAADRDFRSKDFNQMLSEWEAKAEIGDTLGNRVTKYDIAKAQRLYIEAAKIGDMETAMKLVAEIAEVGTTHGQVIQAMRLLKQMPSSYQLYYLRRVVNRLNRQYAKRIDAGKMSELKIDRDLARAVLKAPNQEALDKAMEALIKDIASNVPVTFMDKWNAWRYLSMLGNPKTHIRNIFGNAIFVPAKFSKDLIAAGLEGMFIKDQSKRHTSFKGLLGGRANAEYRAVAEKDYKGIQKELQDGGKYNPTNEIMNARTIFSNKALEFLRKFNGKKLEQEDGAFLRFHYVNAMTNFLATQGMSVKELSNSPEGRKIMEAARLYAVNEAQKATYRDASHIANALNQLKRNSGLMGLILLDGELPFTKTPFNILKRGLEYSPIGLLNTASRGLYKLKNGDISANEFIDGLASGLSGTGIMVLGAWLASMGWLRGGGDDDDKQDDFENLQGYQSYSINIGDHNYTIDWMAPVALPLFVGAEIVKQMQKDGEFKLSDLYNSLLIIAEPFTQLSMLSGLNETIQSVKYDEHPLVSIFGASTSGYFTQAIPTLAAQIARSLPADRRMTYVDKNKDTLPVFQRWWQTNVLGKVPLLNSQRTPYIDAWGRKDTQSSFALRLIENMFSPGYHNRIKTTAVDRELQSLADRVGTGVLMTAPERTVKFNNTEHHLTANQYQTYAKTRGDAAMTMLLDLFNSEGYQDDMSDDEKAYAVNAIKQYADILGKQAVYPDYESDYDNWAEKCDGDPTRVTNMAMLRAQAHELGIETNTLDFHTVILNASYLTPVDQAYAIAQTLALGSDAYVYETGKSSVKYAIDSDDKNLIAEHYRQIFPAYYLPVAGSDKWINATPEERMKLLSQVRSDAKADAKAWLATIKAKQGAPLYVKK